MSSKVLQISEKLLETTTDLLLAAIFFQAHMFNKHSLSQVMKGSDAATRDLEEVNYQTIKRALRRLKASGLLSSKDEITKLGLRRLQAIIPEYQSKRPWDGNLHLITYDIPTSQNYKRDRLREYLKTIGCGLLQESLWITPYNPRVLVQRFVEERSLEGTILVSNIGKDGSVAGKTIQELIESVYNLSNLNMRYKDFLSKAKLENQSIMRLRFLYLSILESDPQLPFELLPEGWLGNKANKTYLNILKK